MVTGQLMSMVGVVYSALEGAGADNSSRASIPASLDTASTDTSMPATQKRALHLLPYMLTYSKPSNEKDRGKESQRSMRDCSRELQSEF